MLRKGLAFVNKLTEFEAIVVIVDEIDQHEAVLAAREKGAGGVTIVDAHGFGFR